MLAIDTRELAISKMESGPSISQPFVSSPVTRELRKPGRTTPHTNMSAKARLAKNTFCVLCSSSTVKLQVAVWLFSGPIGIIRSQFMCLVIFPVQ